MWLRQGEERGSQPRPKVSVSFSTPAQGSLVEQDTWDQGLPSSAAVGQKVYHPGLGFPLCMLWG